MLDQYFIKLLYENEGKSLLEISKQTGLNYRTVQKYAHKENWNEDKVSRIRANQHSLLDGYIAQIDKWLEEYRKVPRKQRHTIKRIHSRLCEEMGFNGSYSTVQKYVHSKRQAIERKYLPLEHPAGDGQVDFGEFRYYDEIGEMKKGYFLAISFPYSNKGYVQAFKGQNQECLLEGMKRIFEYIGGVPKRLRFDNMKTAVSQIKSDG